MPPVCLTIAAVVIPVIDNAVTRAAKRCNIERGNSDAMRLCVIDIDAETTAKTTLRCENQTVVTRPTAIYLNLHGSKGWPHLWILQSESASRLSVSCR